MFLHRTPALARWLWPHFWWRRPAQGLQAYLTFDDGPVPEITEWVLDTLRAHQAKATFFCVGDNVVKHPAIFARLQAEGHAVGNHTFHHRNGRQTPLAEYLANVADCQAVLGPSAAPARALFRPPYGRLTQAQAQALRPHYQVTMWDVLTGDFSQQVSPERCLAKALQYTRPGSIVLWHDSRKAFPKVQFALPRYLAALREKGYEFLPLAL
ncbi:MAG: polysaccharide deacetylase family protein [Bernardetiaceae bacterium]|jgi:peptidoglycan/xylan/chitin deacetylase (PgdA/CDA1 family)|nr:polysaccharide deacetylase family protein [Bernardetiaceae bacterium]